LISWEFTRINNETAVELSSASYHQSPHDPNSGIPYAKRRRQVAVRVGLIDELPAFLLKGFDGVGTCRPPERRVILGDKLHQGVREFGGIAALLSAHAFPRLHCFSRLLGVVIYRRNWIVGRILCEQFCAKEPRLHEHRSNTKGLTSGASDSIHPSTPNFDAE